MTTSVPAPASDRSPVLCRRTLLAAAGATGLLTACGGGSSTPQAAGGADEPVITDLSALREAKVLAFETSDGGKALLSAAGDDVRAFSAICTHQGCTVEYDGGSGQLQCPCHGSAFDAADGSVVRGPAEEPLKPVDVVVDEAEGVVRRA